MATHIPDTFLPLETTLNKLPHRNDPVPLPERCFPLLRSCKANQRRPQPDLCSLPGNQPRAAVSAIIDTLSTTCQYPTLVAGHGGPAHGRVACSIPRADAPPPPAILGATGLDRRVVQPRGMNS